MKNWWTDKNVSSDFGFDRALRKYWMRYTADTYDGREMHMFMDFESVEARDAFVKAVKEFGEV